MLKRATHWALNFGILLGTWFLFVMKGERSELAAGAAAAALAAIGMELARRQERPRFGPRLRDLAQLYRIPAAVAADTVTLIRELPKHPEGFFRLLPFYGGDERSADAGRRALAITFTTIPPNTLVIGIDPPHNRMLVHYVAPAGVPESVRTLGAPPEERQ